MENKLEQLLNSLIEKGWRIENPNARISDVKYMYGLRELRIVYETDRRYAVRQYPIRFLVSKESGLWQFVCENGMVKGDEGIYWHKNGGRISDLRTYDYEFENFWLIESSLKNESELESFILDNIKVDG